MITKSTKKSNQETIKIGLSDAFHNKQNLTGKQSAFGNSFIPTETTVTALIDHIISGKAWTQGYFKSNSRRRDTFISSQTLSLDIDNGTPFQDIMADDFVWNYAALVHPSPSSTPEYPKTRVVFILSEAVSNVDQWEAMQRGLLARFAMFDPDPACKDAARLFYGSTVPGECRNDDLRLPLAVAESLINPDAPKHSDRSAHDAQVSIALVSAVEEALGVAGARLNPRSGFTVEAVPCPFGNHEHDDKKPAAYWHGDKHFLHCFKCGKDYLTKDIAGVLGITVQRPALIHTPPVSTLQPDITVNMRYISEIDPTAFDEPGVYAVKSPQDTGKTALIEHLRVIWREQHLRIGYAAHLNSLVGGLANRMECESHQTLPPRYQRAANELAFCVNSAPHQINHTTGELHTFDVLVIDEIEQVIRAFTSKTMKDNRQQIFNTMTELIKCAKYVILLDADLSPLTIEFIRHIRDDITIIVNEYEDTNRQLLDVETKNDLIKLIDNELDTVPGLIGIACTSEKFAAKLAKRYRKRLGNEAVLLISGETSDEPKVRRFLNNPDAFIGDYTMVIYTTSMGTGVDITTTADAVFGFIGRQPLTGWDAVQMLLRFRNADRYLVWVDPTEQKLPVSLETRYRYWKNREKRTVEVVFSDGKDIAGEQRDFLTRTIARIETHENRSKCNIKTHFHALATQRFTIQQADAAANPEAIKELKAEMKQLTEELKAERHERIRASQPVDDDTYKQHAVRGTLTPEIEAGHDRHIIEKTFAEPISDVTIDDYDDGRGVGRVKLFEAIHEAPEITVASDQQELLNETANFDLSHSTMRRKIAIYALRPFADERGLTTDAVYTRAEITEMYSTFIEKYEQDIRLYFGWRKDYSDEPIQLLRFILRAVGLKLERIGKDRGDEQRYHIEPASLAKMKRYIKQRRQLREQGKAHHAMSE